MKIEVLVTTMHQKDFSKYKEMNLQTDAVIANQAEHNSKEKNKLADFTISLSQSKEKFLLFTTNFLLFLKSLKLNTNFSIT